MKIHIRNGRLIDPANQLDGICDVYVVAGKVAGIGTAPAGVSGYREIDASGQIVAPGFVDLAARLREPGQEHRATLDSELAAAVAGGVTSLACLPDTDPPLDEPGLVEMLKHRARSLNLAHLYPLGALTAGLRGEALTEMTELTQAGCVAFSHADHPLYDTQVLARALEYASTFGYAVWLRPQDAFLARGGVAHDGDVATRLGLAPIPVNAEVIALSTILHLVRTTGARVHLCRLSSAVGVEMIRAAKKEGLPISADIGIHHLHLCDRDLGYFDSNCRMVPPLRSPRDRDALRAALADGTIDAPCSDHAPVDDDAKQVPFAEAEPGATGLELLLPLTLKWAAEMRLPLAAAVAALTCNPARVLGIDAGHLAPGAPADICVFDPQSAWIVDRGALRSQGKHTPFLGLEVLGRVTHTLVAGHIVHGA